jgi:hypothetical protein
VLLVAILDGQLRPYAFGKPYPWNLSMGDESVHWTPGTESEHAIVDAYQAPSSARAAGKDHIVQGMTY